MTTNTTWGNAKGEAQKSGANYMKFANGSNQFRLIEDSLVARYQYWVENAKGEKLPFECLQFDRNAEKFNNRAPDPIREAGLTEIVEEKGVKKEVPLRAKRAYVALAINRADNTIVAVDLKKSIFDGIVDTANQIGKPPKEFDIFVKKTGTKWYEIEYSVEQINCMKDASNPNPTRDEADKALIAAYGKSVTEVFPRATYEDIKSRLTEHLNGGSVSGNPAGTAPEAGSEAAKEAMSELDD